MNRKSCLMLAVVIMLGSTAALGVEVEIMGSAPGHENSRQIPYDELKARCAHPEDFDVQRAPQNIKLQCTDIRREYVQVAPGEVPLPGYRKVVTGVFADKFHVGAMAKDIPMFTKGGSCQRFQEVEKTLTIERPLTCMEIIGMKSSIEEFCTTALDAAKAANPKLVEVRTTDTRMIDTCGGFGGPIPK